MSGKFAGADCRPPRIGSRCAYDVDGDTTTRERQIERRSGDDGWTGVPVAQAHQD